MSLAPLLAASPAIQLHAFAALLSCVLVAIVWIRRKGDALHRWTGRAWAAAMAVTALSSFWIFDIRDGRPSPIHILSVVALVSLVGGVTAARRGRIDRHRKFMRGLSIGALLLAGGFTLLPGRIMHAVVFGG